ncbi:hypothetical protein COOONC_27740 [Cooperia oncophora]
MIAHFIASVETMWTNATTLPAPIKDVAVATSDAATKKRAAPPPPLALSDTVSAQTYDTNKELFVEATTLSHPSMAPSHLASPGRAALNILDDLTSALDKQKSCSLRSIADGMTSTHRMEQ